MLRSAYCNGLQALISRRWHMMCTVRRLWTSWAQRRWSASRIQSRSVSCPHLFPKHSTLTPPSAGPPPCNDHPKATRLLCAFHSHLDSRAANKSPRTCPLLRRVLCRGRAVHPTRDGGVRCTRGRSNPRGGVAAGWAAPRVAEAELGRGSKGKDQAKGDELLHRPGVGADTLEADDIPAARSNHSA